MNWTVEATSEVVTTIRIDGKRNADWEQWALLTSDRHDDNPKSDRRMQEKHLRQAKERGAFILDAGDLFCAMQGKGDRRSAKGDVRPEDDQKDYLGALVRNRAEFFKPYGENFAVLGEGNHETAVTNNKEFNLTAALVAAMNANGSPVVKGGYRGWVRLLFSLGTFRAALNMYYTHGAGGGGPVTRGVINTNRRAVYTPDAHIVFGGHIHEAWTVEIPRTRLNDAGAEFPDEQTHICLPTYKEEFFGTANGFHHEKERAPKPKGAWWIRFFFDRSDYRIKYEPMRAK